MLRTCKLLLTTIVALGLSTSLATTALAQGKGKPGKGGGGSTLPPVRYQVQFWTIPGAIYIGQVSDTNSFGQTVGSFEYDRDGDGRSDTLRAYLYDPDVDPAYRVDLNLIVAGIPGGWEIRNATAINEVGQIAGYIAPATSTLGSPTLLQAVMIDLAQNPPQLYAVPDGTFTTYSIAGGINDWGDLIATYQNADGSWGYYIYNFEPAAGIIEPYDLGISASGSSRPKINNLRQVVGRVGDWDGFRMSWSGGTEFFTGLNIAAINHRGNFCGRAIVSLRGNKFSEMPFLYSASLETHNVGSYTANDVNESLDFITVYTLYHRTLGALNILDMLDPADPDSVIVRTGPAMYIYCMNDRDSVTNFPRLAGQHGGVGVTLTPVSVP